ncbi:small membrane protein YmiC [Escherichia coli]
MINTNMKYWSWMGAFSSLSMLFWAELLWIITH